MRTQSHDDNCNLCNLYNMPDTGHVMGQVQRKNMKDIDAVLLLVLLPRSITVLYKYYINLYQLGYQLRYLKELLPYKTEKKKRYLKIKRKIDLFLSFFSLNFVLT